MAHEFTKKLTPLNGIKTLGELEYGEGKEIHFSGFSSCIGIVLKRENTLFAIHLVLNDGKTLFNDTDFAKVVSLIGAGEKVLIIGKITYWKGSVPAIYQKIVENFYNSDSYDENYTVDGTFGAKLTEDGEIQAIQYVDNDWVNI